MLRNVGCIERNVTAPKRCAIRDVPEALLLSGEMPQDDEKPSEEQWDGYRHHQHELAHSTQRRRDLTQNPLTVMQRKRPGLVRERHAPLVLRCSECLRF